MQGINTKFPYVLCEWDSRARENHYLVKHWWPRRTFILEEKNVLNITLTMQTYIILTTLLICIHSFKIILIMSFCATVFQPNRHEYTCFPAKAVCINGKWTNKRQSCHFRCWCSIWKGNYMNLPFLNCIYYQYQSKLKI